MGSSRYLNPTTPGGLLSPGPQGLTPNEELIMQAIENGTFFVTGVVLTDTGDHKNYTLPSAPNPTNTLAVYRNGKRLSASDPDDGWSLSTSTNVLTVKTNDPADIITADYHFSPV